MNESRQRRISKPAYLLEARKKSTKINFLGSGDSRVGWGSSMRRGGGRKARALESLSPLGWRAPMYWNPTNSTQIPENQNPPQTQKLRNSNSETQKLQLRNSERHPGKILGTSQVPPFETQGLSGPNVLHGIYTDPHGTETPQLRKLGKSDGVQKGCSKKNCVYIFGP